MSPFHMKSTMASIAATDSSSVRYVGFHPGLVSKSDFVLSAWLGSQCGKNVLKVLAPAPKHSVQVWTSLWLDVRSIT